MKKIIIIISVLIANLSFAQQTDFVDVLKIEAKIAFQPDSSKVNVSGIGTFKVLKAIDSVYLDAINFKFNHVELLNRPLEGFGFENTQNQLRLQYNFKAGEEYQFAFEYSAYPKQALYFLKRHSLYQIWTQGQGKNTSNWLLSLDDVNDKIEFDLKVEFDSGYEVLANGKFVNKEFNDSLAVWEFDMQKPMPSYLVALAIGKYHKKTEVSQSGIPLEYYYYPEDSLKVEPTYRYSKLMFDYLEKEIGVPYPWQNYKQVPVHDFLYAGMENTSLTIFSDAFMVDAIGFNDKNYVNVNAHELAHQWFGNLVTATSGEHHWLQEGFATYYALLAEREVFGSDYYYFKLYQMAQDLGRQDLEGKGTSLLNPKSSSLTFYQRGAWVLHALRSKIGDDMFRQAVKNYLVKYQFKNVETSDFISEVERVAEIDLTAYVDKWMVQKEFPFDEAIGLLKAQSYYIQEYVMVDCEAKTSKCPEYIKYDVSDDAKVKIIAQMPELVTKDVFKNSLKVRRAISEYVSKIPNELKSDYESLLNDQSYVTIENALYHLWVNFPLERAKYLVKTKDVMGLNDKNVKLLWLVLHLNTPEFQADKKQAVYEELVSYTNEKYNVDVRISAFKYLDLIKACNSECQSNLEKAKTHHNWRMVKFAKQMEIQLEKNKE